MDGEAASVTGLIFMDRSKLEGREGGQLLFSCAEHVLQWVDGENVVRRWCQSDAGSEALAAIPGRAWHVLSIGKAAPGMLRGWQICRPSFEAARSLMVTKPGIVGLPEVDECIESDHPVPGEASLRAGVRVLGFLSSIPEGDRWILLLSGGASSLMSYPWLESPAWRELGNRLVRSGLAIDDMNRIRARFDRCKGGGLLQAAAANAGLTLAISDLPDLDPVWIGGGPTSLISHDDVHVFRQLVDLGYSKKRIEKWLLYRNAQSEPQAPRHRLFCGASVQDMRNSAADYLESRVSKVKRVSLGGDLPSCARSLVKSLGGLQQQTQSGGWSVVIAAGETQYKLPVDTRLGRGGRNAVLALQCALELQREADSEQEWAVLSLATDGDDGNSGRAGGLIMSQELRENPDWVSFATRALVGYDSSDWLDACGLSLVYPVGKTNVADLCLLASRRRVV